MNNLTITIEEQKIILYLINHVRRSIDPNFDFFKKQRQDLNLKINNNLIDQSYKNQ